MEREERRIALAKKRRRKVQKMRRILVVGIAVAVIVGIITVISNGMFWIDRITMSKTKEDLKVYYGITTEEQLAVIIDDEKYAEDICGKYWDGEPYIEYEVAREKLNSKLYVDMNENILLYTLPEGTIRADVGSSEYTFQKEKKQWKCAPLRMEGEKAYIALSFVKEHTGLEYRVYQDDLIDRVVIDCKEGEIKIAEIKRPVHVRTMPDRKATVLARVERGEQVSIIEKDSSWLKIRTEDGFIGYVRNRYLKNEKTKQVNREDKEIVADSISKDYTINMAWHLVSNKDANDNIFEMIADEEGLTTISPTWFTIEDTEGNIQSLADQRYVDYIHKFNKEVWALVKDFDGGIEDSADTYKLLSHSSSRENLINQLMAEVVKYDIDGINVDFELVSEECSVHFLQFIRELSVRCRQNEIVLSVDNYVPTEHNQYYNLGEQAVYADYIIIMGYDEHHAGSTESGPVASTAFVENGIVNALKSVPANKLINAVPFYTRLWCEKTKKDGSVEVTSIAYGMDEAEMKVSASGAEIVQDKETGHNYAQWKDGKLTYRIWLEDAFALESKLKLMKEYKLAGLSAWRLGFEGRETWELILKYVN